MSGLARDLIYLDNNATTPADPRVIEAMMPYFFSRPGNAASKNHAFGWEAQEAVDAATREIAGLIQVEPNEVVYTSGATESDNLAIKGVYAMYHRKGNHIITVGTEHKAVLDACQWIEKQGGEVSYLSVDSEGRIDLEELSNTIRETTILVSIMWANNETGVIQPMEEIGKICRVKGVLLMSDATQAVGKIPVCPRKIGVHLMAFSAHKMYGPKGVGALFINRSAPRVKLAPQIHGGGHQMGIRSGTLNVPGIVGFGKAAQLANEEMTDESRRLRKLRDQLELGLISNLEEVYRNGHELQRLPHVANLSFLHVEGERLMSACNKKIALSSGSACTSASLEPSYVLSSMGCSESRSRGSLRFSLGRFTADQDIDTTISVITEAVDYLRSISPIWEMYKEGVDLEAI